MPISHDQLPVLLTHPAFLRAELRRRQIRTSSDAEILAWILDTFGVQLPTVACCPGHAAPAQAFLDALLCRAPVAVWKASRGFGGKTFLLGLLALVEAILFEIDVTVLGGSGQQSARVVDRIHRFLARSEVARLWLDGEPGLQKTTLAWGNTIEALTASPTSVRGAHPTRLRLDEADEMSLRILEAAQGQPMDHRGVRAQTVISSTHQHPDGTMTAVLKRAAELGWPVYQWCFHETMEPHGWLSPGQIERKRAEVSRRMWEIEYELQEPSAEGRALDPAAVERMFDPSMGAAVTAQALEFVWQLERPPITRPGAERADGPWYTVGIDWAQARDYTVAAVLRCDTTPFQLVAVYRTHRRPWPEMTDRVGALLDMYPGPSAHDYTGGGRAIREFPALRHRDQLMDFTMVGRERTDLFRDYIGAVERHELWCPRIDALYAEHKYCSEDDLFGGGHPPDTVVAMALAYHAFRRGRRPGDYGITV